jgi:gliding motility-associated-like protein
LSAYTGTVLNWIVSTDGGATWSSIASTADSLNYLSITANTVYAAVVQNAACPVDTSAFANFIIVPPSVGGTVGPNDSVCYLSNNGAVTLSGNTGTIVTWISSTDGGLSWTNLSTGGSTFPYNALTQTTTYAAVVQNSSCPADTSASATITVLLPMPVSAGSDTTLQPGESVSLNGTGTGIPLWTPSTGLDSTSIFSPLASPTETTTYLLSVIDNNGCINSDAVTVTVISPVFNGIITTLFTPNGDGVNDYWYIQNIENFPDNEVIIYNIHGQKIYNKKGYMNDWQGTYNGQNLPDGTYYYILKFEKEEAVFKGSLDILSNK